MSLPLHTLIVVLVRLIEPKTVDDLIIIVNYNHFDGKIIFRSAGISADFMVRTDRKQVNPKLLYQMLLDYFKRL